MAIFKDDTKTTIGNIDTSKVMAVTISPEEMLRMVKKNVRDLYSDKLRAAVVEIVSNGLDAHADAGIDRPVHVSINNTNEIFGEGATIVVTDYGRGMTEDKIDKVYRQFGASDKTDKSDVIGAFGVGAMAPLAICSTFYFTTRAEGKETSWLVGEIADNSSFGVYKINERDYEGETGTSVTIPLDELSTKGEELNKQLRLIFYNNLYRANIEVEGLEPYHWDEVIWEKGGIQICKQTRLAPWESYYRYNNNLKKGNFKIDINGVRYHQECKLSFRDNSYYISVKVKPGVFRPNLSRETLDLSYENGTSIIAEMANRVKALWLDQLKDITSFIDYVKKLKNAPFTKTFSNIQLLHIYGYNRGNNDFYRSGHYYGRRIGPSRISENLSDETDIYVSHSKDQYDENTDGIEYKRIKTLFETKSHIFLIRHYDKSDYKDLIEEDIKAGKITRLETIPEAKPKRTKGSKATNKEDNLSIPCLKHFGHMQRSRGELNLNNVYRNIYWYTNDDPLLAKIDESDYSKSKYFKNAVSFVYNVQRAQVLHVSKPNAKKLRKAGFKHITEIPQEVIDEAYTIHVFGQALNCHGCRNRNTKLGERFSFYSYVSNLTKLFKEDKQGSRFQKQLTFVSDKLNKYHVNAFIFDYFNCNFDKKLAKKLYIPVEIYTFFMSYDLGVKSIFSKRQYSYKTVYDKPNFNRSKFFQIKKEYIKWKNQL